MWFNENEEILIKPFFDFIYKNEGEKIHFKFNSGLEIIVTLYLYEYESDNGLDIHNDDYEEYWEMAFEISDIIHDDSNKYRVGDKILVNYHSIPDIYDIK